MDAEDLIARENEFKKLNKQLERKTESLMKEIERSMQKQDIFSEFKTLTLSPAHSTTKKHCCAVPVSANSTPEKKCVTNQHVKKINQEKVNRTDKNTNLNTENKNNITDSTETQIHTKCNCNCYILSSNKKDGDFEFLYAFVSVSVKDNVLPPSFLKDNLTIESICKFLSAKVKLMQEQIDKLQGSLEKKVKQCEKHMTQLAELESERLTYLNRANSLRAETADMKSKYAVIQNRLSEKDRLYKEQRSVTDKLTTELKQIKCKNTSLEARCASQEESITTLKQQIEAAKMSEKEFRNSTRTLSASHQNAIQRLESRVKALTSRTDRQNALVDNLKKQNALLQTDAALKALEKEYCEFLKQDL